MRQLSDSFKNASFLLCGISCTLFVIYHLLNRVLPYEEFPAIPGFGHTLGLCWGALFLWAGMLLRRRLPSLRWWVQLPVLALAMFCLYKYRHDVWITYRSLPYLYLSVFGAGFLVPPEAADREGERSGWLDLALLFVSAFCYTAVSVVQGRFQSTSPFMPQFKDMERLLVWLMNNTMPLVLFIAMYFAVRFWEGRSGSRWYRAHPSSSHSWPACPDTGSPGRICSVSLSSPQRSISSRLRYGRGGNWPEGGNGPGHPGRRSSRYEHFNRVGERSYQHINIL